MHSKIFELSLVTRKPVFRICEQGRLKLACSASEASYSLEILDLATISIILIILSKQRTTKALIVFADVQADLRFCCSHMVKAGFVTTWHNLKRSV